jgi:hypothetical protein
LLDRHLRLAEAQMKRHEIQLDLRGVDLAALHTDADIRREARQLLPAALEDLGQALAEAAWAGVRERTPDPAVRLPDRPEAMREFLVEAGRRYRRHAPVADRTGLEELIVQRLWAATALAAAGTKDEPGSTVTPGESRAGVTPAAAPDPPPFCRNPMRTLEYTLSDGTTAAATPDDVASAVEVLLMDGTMVLQSGLMAVRLNQVQNEEARLTAIVRAVVERARERGVVPEVATGPAAVTAPPAGQIRAGS